MTIQSWTPDRSVARNVPRGGGGCPPVGKRVGPEDHFSVLYSPPAVFSPRGVPGHPLHTPWLQISQQSRHWNVLHISVVTKHRYCSKSTGVHWVSFRWTVYWNCLSLAVSEKFIRTTHPCDTPRYVNVIYSLLLFILPLHQDNDNNIFLDHEPQIPRDSVPLFLNMSNLRIYPKPNKWQSNYLYVLIYLPHLFHSKLSTVLLVHRF